ncbi:MAG: hypothetical protein B6D36_06755 [Planctomycetes bacterium UTPLA1]|nr:MAG: hypothetical protein B6D36_06755 [Planctomycetes bacterium UTPLA1]
MIAKFRIRRFGVLIREFGPAFRSPGRRQKAWGRSLTKHGLIRRESGLTWTIGPARVRICRVSARATQFEIASPCDQVSVLGRNECMGWRVASARNPARWR